MVSKIINWDCWLLNKISYSHPYVYALSRSLCIPFADGESKTISSAYMRWLITLSPLQHPIGNLFSDILRILIYTLNNRGERIPPCLTPLFTGNTSDITDPHLTQSVWFEYHWLITLMINFGTPLFNNCLKSLSWFTRSNIYIYIAWNLDDDWIQMCTVIVYLIKYYLNMLHLTNIEGHHYLYYNSP